MMKIFIWQLKLPNVPPRYSPATSAHRHVVICLHVEWPYRTYLEIRQSLEQIRNLVLVCLVSCLGGFIDLGFLIVLNQIEIRF